MLGQIKTLLRDSAGIPPFLVLMAVGLAAHLVCNLILKKPMTSAYGLILPLVVGVCIEGYEIWMQYRDIGLLSPNNDPVVLILFRHFLDVVYVLTAPMALVVGGLLTR